jgi:hypothetical protein
MNDLEKVAPRGLTPEIQLLIMDVDGVLTDGGIIRDEVVSRSNAFTFVTARELSAGAKSIGMSR